MRFHLKTKRNTAFKLLKHKRDKLLDVITEGWCGQTSPGDTRTNNSWNTWNMTDAANQEQEGVKPHPLLSRKPWVFFILNELYLSTTTWTLVIHASKMYSEHHSRRKSKRKVDVETETNVWTKKIMMCSSDRDDPPNIIINLIYDFKVNLFYCKGEWDILSSYHLSLLGFKFFQNINSLGSDRFHLSQYLLVCKAAVSKLTSAEPLRVSSVISEGRLWLVFVTLRIISHQTPHRTSHVLIKPHFHP